MGATSHSIRHSVRHAQTAESDNLIGYDVTTGKFVNMIDAGIIDPVQVTWGTLENATSIASMILTTEALITDSKQSQSVS
jgi:chaperonin GroEL